MGWFYVCCITCISQLGVNNEQNVVFDVSLTHIMDGSCVGQDKIGPAQEQPEFAHGETGVGLYVGCIICISVV